MVKYYGRWMQMGVSMAGLTLGKTSLKGGVRACHKIKKIWCKDDMHDELINQQLKLHDLTSDYDKWLSMRKYVNI